MKAKKWMSVAINALIAVMVPVEWGMMLTRRGGLLTATGLESLKYFTVLSNILMGIASLIFLICIFARLPLSGWVARLKYTATVAVGLTFFTVMFFLGPLYGYLNMLMGANLWLHLIIPVAAMADFIILWDEKPTLPDSVLALIPMIIYGVAYFLNILINGRGEHFENDWYAFAAGGTVASVFVLVGMALATWVLALLIRFLNGKITLPGPDEDK